MVGDGSESEEADKVGGRFGDRGDREIDLAAVSGVVTEVVCPRLICDCPAAFGSRITSDSGDKTVIGRSSSDTEIDDVELLQGLKGDRAAGANCQSRMGTRCAERQLDDGTGTHGHGAFHGEGLAGRSSAGFEYRAARRD